LIRKGYERPCFDYYTFHIRFTDCNDLLLEVNECSGRTKRKRDGDTIEEKEDEEKEESRELDGIKAA